MARTFGEYEILDKLGQGGMGAVFKARRRSSGRIVALKVVLSHAGVSRKARDRFLREARTMARLRHPNIVSIFEIGEQGSTPFIAMEYVEGRTLADILGDRIPDQREAVQWMLKIARAVAHAHDQGIIHRDLKPANVVINAGGEPVVMDFGIARDLLAEERLTLTGAVIGTPSYMSPEQVGGTPVDARSDVFCLGAILYSLLSGKLPFDGPSTAVIMLKVAEEDPVPLAEVNPAVSADLATVCTRAMRKSPAERYADAHALADDLAAFLDGAPIKGRPATAVERVRRKVRSARIPMTGAAVAVVILVALLSIAAVLLSLAPGRETRAAVVAPSGGGGEHAKSSGTPGSSDAETTAGALPAEPKPAPEPDAAFERDLAAADAMLKAAHYQQAVNAYGDLVSRAPTPASKQEAERGLARAGQLLASSEQSKKTPETGTVAEGDRFLASGRFDEAAGAYAAAGADADRRELAARLIKLRTDAATVLAGGARLPAVLKSGSATVCSMDSRSVVVAGAAGAMGARRWESVSADDIYRLYRACFRNPTAEQHLDLGLLCVALGLQEDARREFDQAAQLDAGARARVEKFLRLKLAR